jgi:hypothetical protein
VVQLPRRRAADPKSRGTKPRRAAKRHDAAGTSGLSAHRRRPVDVTIPAEFGRIQPTTAKPTGRSQPATEAPTGAGPVLQPTDSVGAWLKAQVNRLLAGVRHAGDVLKNKIQEWMDTLADAVADGGAGLRAAVAGIAAVLTGKNPIWAAIKGLMSGLSGPAKAALVLLVTLGLLVLGPILLLVLLLALLVVALIVAFRAASQ